MKLEKNLIVISKEKLVEILDNQVPKDVKSEKWYCSDCVFNDILDENLNEDFELKWDKK